MPTGSLEASCPPHHWLLGSTGAQLPNKRWRGHWRVERKATCCWCGETKIFAEREFTDDKEARYAGGGNPRHDAAYVTSADEDG